MEVKEINVGRLINMKCFICEINSMLEERKIRETMTLEEEAVILL